MTITQLMLLIKEFTKGMSTYFDIPDMIHEGCRELKLPNGTFGRVKSNAVGLIVAAIDGNKWLVEAHVIDMKQSNLQEEYDCLFKFCARYCTERLLQMKLRA